jgi:hypothetical protein
MCNRTAAGHGACGRVDRFGRTSAFKRNADRGRGYQRPSRHGLPLRTTHYTASTNSRLSLPLRPGSVGLSKQRGSIFARWGVS